MMADAPSPPWKLACPWCEWAITVSARGGRGHDQGSGYAAAKLGERHAALHGKTWGEFLALSDAASRGARAGVR